MKYLLLIFTVCVSLSITHTPKRVMWGFFGHKKSSTSISGPSTFLHSQKAAYELNNSIAFYLGIDYKEERFIKCDFVG